MPVHATNDAPADAVPGEAERGEGRARFVLDEHLPFLVGRLAGKLAQAFSGELAERGLSLKMWRVVSVLADRGEQRLTDLAELTAIDASTLSRLIVAMQRRRLVQRRRSSKNKREIGIQIAPAGLQVLGEVVPHALNLEAVLIRDVPADEVARVKQVLHRLFDNATSLPPPRTGSRGFGPEEL